MGNFYKQQLTVQQWLTTHGISGDTAAAWTTASFAAWAEDSGGAAEATLARLLAEQTPGGLNEKAPVGGKGLTMFIPRAPVVLPQKVGLGWVPCSGPVIPNLRR